MPNYQWTGINKEGYKITGANFANDKNELLTQLKGNHICPLYITKKISINIRHKKKFNTITFLQKLFTLIQAGISIAEAISLTEDTKNSETIKEIHAQLLLGNPLSSSLQNFPSIFCPLSIALIKIGETTGTLEKNLHQLLIYRKNLKQLKQKIKAALIYPSITIGLTILLLILMCCLIVPKFQVFFSEMNGQLPLFTKVILFATTKIKAFFFFICISAIMGLTYWQMQGKKSERAQKIFHQLIFSLPILKSLLQLHLFALSLHTLSTTLKAGILLTDAFNMAASLSRFTAHSFKLRWLSEKIRQGLSLSEALHTVQAFDSHIQQLLTIGEKSGKLDEMCAHLAEHYFQKLNDFTQRLSMLIEPILTIILSVIIGTITIALYLPLFSLGRLF